MFRHQMVKNGSMVVTLGHEKLEKETVYLLVVAAGEIVDQAVLSKGHGFITHFIGAALADIEDWVNDQSTDEIRKVFNSYCEDTNVIFMDSTIQIPRPRSVGHHCEGATPFRPLFSPDMGNGKDGKELRRQGVRSLHRRVLENTRTCPRLGMDVVTN